MASYRENHIIERLRQIAAPDISLGLLDDGAAVCWEETSTSQPSPCDSLSVYTTDSLHEGVHFQSRIAADDLAYKALVSNISDLLAMGANPKFYLLNLGLPSDTPSAWVDQFINGLRDTQTQFKIQLIGGDTTRSPTKTITITAFGRARRNHLKTRQTSQAGDLIAVSDFLGDSRAGLQLLEGQASVPARHPLAQAHLRPRIDVAKAQWLASQKEVTAMMDLSDGLYADLPKLLKASQLGAHVRLDRLPKSHELNEYIGDKPHSWEFPLYGGEDYCLLYTIQGANALAFCRRHIKQFGCSPFLIGKTLNTKGLNYFDYNQKTTVNDESFQHF